jgi:hypothetical protein
MVAVMKDAKLTTKASAVQTSPARTPFPEALMKVLETLKEKGNSFTVSRLALETRLHRRTVEKVVDLLPLLQKYLEESKITIEELNRVKLIRLQRRVGLADLPERTQKLIIRSLYYPEPSQEQMLLVHLLIRNATSPENALKLEGTNIVTKLKRQGQIIEDRGRFYLSDEGIIVARGTLDLYPELADIASGDL